jgi:hypothetical protein
MAKPSQNQMTEFYNQVRNGRITSASFQRFIDKPEAPSGQTAFSLQLYPATVDRSMGWLKMLEATKIKTERVGRDFTEEHFSLGTTPGYEYDLALIRFNHDPSWDDILDVVALPSQEFKRPEPEDLLAFGATYPDVQLEFPIIAPVTRPWKSLDGRGSLPCFDGDLQDRYLTVERISPTWFRYCRFLLRKLRKPAEST